MRTSALSQGLSGCLLALFGVFRLVGQAQPEPLLLESSRDAVTCHEVVEFLIRGVGDYAEPFDPEVVDLKATVTSADWQITVPAFYSQPYERGRHGGRDWFYPAGPPGWKARVAVPRTGDYEVRAVLKDARGSRSSPPVRFACVRAAERANPGFIRVAEHDPRWLEFGNGEPFFPIGQNLAFIGSQQYVTLTRADSILARLSANGANYLRIWTGCEDWALALEARKSAWGRSWERRTATVPEPGAEGRRCVFMTNQVLPVNPSHELALRPATRYRVTGRVRVSATNALRLEVQGTVSMNLAPATAGVWGAFLHEFTTDADDRWLSGMRFRMEQDGSAWIADLFLKEAGGGPELLWEAEVNRPVRGWYNPLDCFWLDELVAGAQRQGIYLQLCLLTRDLYMAALKDPASPAYDQAIADAKKTFRYAVARWGAYTSVAAWEYWNEMDPGLPTDRFYTELGEFLERTDPWRHLRTTSTWGPSARDCRHPKLDFADVHFYLRPADASRLRDEVEGVLDRARWLREHAPNKPAHQGESGLADDQWRITDEMKRSRDLADFHNMLWASALSGTTGTALPWWWERLDEREAYAHYRPLHRFIAEVPWTRGRIESLLGTAAAERVRVVGLRSRTPERAWLWFFHRDASWKQTVTAGQTPSPVADAAFELDGWPDGPHHVEWWDTRRGEILKTEQVSSGDGKLCLTAPAFTHDAACAVGK